MSHSPKLFVEESFAVAVMSGTGNVWIRRGEYQDFPSKIFCLTVPKNFVGECFTVTVMSGTEKVWIRGGEYHDFPSKIFRLTVRKISVGESFTVALLSVTEKLSIERGGSFKVLRRTFFVSQCRKISWGNLLVLH